MTPSRLLKVFILWVPFYLVGCEMVVIVPNPGALLAAQSSTASEATTESDLSAATDLTWAQGSASTSLSLTAQWVPSDSTSMTHQILQFYSDGTCTSTQGEPLLLGASITDYSFTGSDNGTFSFLIVSSNADGSDSVASPCSPSVTIDLPPTPTLTLGSPSTAQINSAMSSQFVVTYLQAEEIQLDAADIQFTYTGTVQNCTAQVALTHSTTRTVTISTCSGDGTARITVLPGSATNSAGSDPGVGPSSSVTVKNSGCTLASATNYDPIATVDDGSCVIFGCLDPAAANFDSDATNDDGNCLYPGCTDNAAWNFDPSATQDDGSCQY